MMSCGLIEGVYDSEGRRLKRYVLTLKARKILGLDHLEK